MLWQLHLFTIPAYLGTHYPCPLSDPSLTQEGQVRSSPRNLTPTLPHFGEPSSSLPTPQLPSYSPHTCPLSFMPPLLVCPLSGLASLKNVCLISSNGFPLGRVLLTSSTRGFPKGALYLVPFSSLQNCEPLAHCWGLCPTPLSSFPSASAL